MFVIAEVGINHHGDPVLCARMIEAAAKAGADAVKLQTIDADESYVVGTDSYKEFSGKGLDDAAMADLMQLAERLNVVLFSTPGDFPSLERMVRIGMPAAKISSGLLTNQPLIVEAAKHKLPLIISTGMAYENEIASAINHALNNGAPGVAVLKCTALYPAPDETLNLSAIPLMAERFGVPIGYSDHTLDDLACVSAVALGAVIIEKHFTLDSKLSGADHRISMEPEPFTHMVGKIRQLEAMRGDGAIKPVAAEEEMRLQRHRCLIARTDIAEGELFTYKNVALKRPLPGHHRLAPDQYELILGRVAKRFLRNDEPITRDAVGD